MAAFCITLNVWCHGCHNRSHIVSNLKNFNMKNKLSKTEQPCTIHSFVLSFFNNLFALKTIYIFKNKKYRYHYSAEHKGKYIFINPIEFGGAGLSERMDRCGSCGSIYGCKEMIEKWVNMYYNDDIKNYRIIERIK